MKAILVIDMPDDFNMKGAYADCIVYEGGKHRTWNRIAHIKPLPEKKKEIAFEETIKSYMFGRSVIILEKAMDLVKAKAYNKCLEDILGEEE